MRRTEMKLNVQPAAPSGLPTLPPDRAQIIRRSLRCFIFGLIGVLPLFGLAAAGLALQLGRKIAEETGERWSFKAVSGCWICGLILINLYSFAVDNFAAVAVAVIFLGLQVFLLRSLYRNNPAKEWNPARHLMYWGVGLAYTGWVASIGLVIYALVQLTGTT
jgi:hypothetical protein